MDQFNELTNDNWVEMDRVASRFLAADRVGLMVGLVMVPLLFGGIAAAMWSLLPAPIGAIVGKSILGAGAVVFGFLLWYRHRVQSRLAFVAEATVSRWILEEAVYGQEAHAVEATIHGAFKLDHGAKGAAMEALPEKTKKLRLTSSKLYKHVTEGTRTLLVCMPTEQVVAIMHDGQLTTA